MASHDSLTGSEHPQSSALAQCLLTNQGKAGAKMMAVMQGWGVNVVCV